MNTTTTIKAAGFVVIFGSAIYGAGTTEAAAAKDAREWVDDESRVPNTETRGEALSQAKMKDEMYMIPATAALVEYVSENGTPDRWGEVGGIACTNEEESAE